MGALPLAVPADLVRAVHLGAAPAAASAPAQWTFGELRGRLTEISGVGDSACLTLALSVVLDAQQAGEPAAWVTRTESCFFPLDAWAGGIDLDALAVVRLPDDDAIARAADRLARSSGFGLLVLDLGSGSDKATALGQRTPRVSPALQSRLRGLAQRHDTAVLCLTRKQASSPSLGSLVSLRATATRRRDGDSFRCDLGVIKDKQRGPGWRASATYRGPDGLL